MSQVLKGRDLSSLLLHWYDITDTKSHEDITVARRHCVTKDRHVLHEDIVSPSDSVVNVYIGSDLRL